jgi:hypothetical protein
MAKYLVLIYGDEQEWAAESPAEQERKHEGHRQFVAAAGERIIGGHQLLPPETATTLRQGAEPGRPLVTDGPFLETKEGLGGYYLLEADDLDAALALARRLPELAVAHTAVEVRPILEQP